MRSSSVILLSGGLDSLASLHWASVETDIVLAITFDYGQRAANNEINSAKQICANYDVKHRVIELPWLKEMEASALLSSEMPLPHLKAEDLDNPLQTKESAEAVWVPNRNGVFLNIAATYAEQLQASFVIVGFNAEEAQTFPDNSIDFVKSANQFFKYSTQGRVLLKSPMAELSKVEIMRWILKEGVDLSCLWSCYEGGNKMCGRCESCLRCKRALTSTEGHSWMEKLF